jgi:uncharacterized protein YkwD
MKSLKYVNALLLALIICLLIGITILAQMSYTTFLPIIYGYGPEDRLLDLINAERWAQGLDTLSTHATLTQVAEAHSQDMVGRNFFSHTNPDGLGPGERLDNAGYEWQGWGETLGTEATPVTMFNSWMKDPPHRDILLNPGYSEVGIGYVAGGTHKHYWTAIFTRPK